MRSTPAMLVMVLVGLTFARDARAQVSYRWYATPTRAPTATPTPNVPSKADAFQVRYAANLAIGDSVVNLTNAGTEGGSDPAGNICANVYVFSADEQMIACCACPITPDGLNSLSVRNDLISNTLTPAVPTSVVIKLVASTPVGGRSCNPSSPLAGSLASGLRAWGTTIHALPTTPVTYGVTETEFSPAVLSASELDQLTSFCRFIQDDGSGFGICRSCRLGGQ